MGQLVFQATLGGQVNLVGPNTASTFNINVPAVAGNMVTTGDTGTVSSTMLASSLSLTTPNINVATATTINGLTVGKGAGSVATNTAVGASALDANTTGASNTAVGQNALLANTDGTQNTAMGRAALTANTSGILNSGFGRSSLLANTTGSSNTAVGGSALAANTTASNNTAVGYQAGYSNTTGTSLTYLGYQAGRQNNTGVSNTSIGYQASYFTTTGSYNTSVGQEALLYNTTANNNTAVGYQAGYTGSNTGFQASTLIGRQAGYTSNPTDASAYGNTCVGTSVGYSLTTGYANTFVGCVGYGGGSPAGYAVTSGTYNSFFGSLAGNAVTTGSKNTIIGSYTGNQNGLDIRTTSNWVVISDGDGNPRVGHDGIATGRLYPQGQSNLNYYGFDTSQFYPLPDNTFRLGNASYRWSTVYATTGTINTSDANTKQDIAELDDAEKRVAVAIKSLIKKYRFKDAVAEKGEAARIHVGAVAQEVAASFEAEGLDPSRYALFCSDTWYEVDGKAAEPATPYTAETEGAVEVTRLGLRYEELLAFVIAAM